MNAFNFLFILAGILYGIFIDSTFWKIYGVLVAIYIVIACLGRNQKENVKRKNIMISTWSECLDPTSYVCQDLQMDKLFDYVKQANED
jgi:hypothetical protein